MMDKPVKFVIIVAICLILSVHVVQGKVSKKQEALKINFIYNNGEIQIESVESVEAYVPSRLIQPETGYEFVFFSDNFKELYKFKMKLKDYIIFENLEEHTYDIVDTPRYTFFEMIPKNDKFKTMQIEDEDGNIVLTEDISKYIKGGKFDIWLPLAILIIIIIILSIAFIKRKREFDLSNPTQTLRIRTGGGTK
jgi:hypothetical protein